MDARIADRGSRIADRGSRIADRGSPQLWSGLSHRSPLRYPGGKSRAVAHIRRYFPRDISSLCSPFLGGASIELDCAARGITVYGSDAFEPLVNFWRYALDDAAVLAQAVQSYRPLTKEQFYDLQRSFNRVTDNLQRAAIYFVLNRSSFSGTTLSGGMSPNHPRFTESAISRLAAFANTNLLVDCLDYAEAIEKHHDSFLYLDPPYWNGQKLYGRKGDMHDGFDHAELAWHLWRRQGWILSYNDCPEVRALYRGYRIVEPSWTYGMSGEGKRRSQEILIIDA